MPVDGTGATLLRWAVAMVEDYRECSARQAGLVQAWPR